MALLTPLFRWTLTAALTLWLVACAAVPAAPPAPLQLLHDELFPRAGTPIDPAQLFAPSPAMQDFLHARLAHPGHPDRALEALVEAMSRDDILRLGYDSSRTRSAAEAFEDHAGNCLSLVMLTASFAHALGLPVQYHLAEIEPYWSRQGRLLVASGHVDLTVSLPLREIGVSHGSLGYTFDFLSPQDARTLPTRDISEDTVIAMFLNNRAAEALVDEQLDRAYAWARLAVQRDPGFAPAYNTLGVIYLHAGAAADAAPAFRAALLLDADNPRMIGNLIDAVSTLGDRAEAQRLQASLDRIEPEPPYRLFDLGTAAFQRKDYAAAQALFRRAVGHTDYDPEVHFWLARAAWALGQPARAQREIEQALALATSSHQRSRYTAKLDWLRAQTHSSN